AFARLDYKVAYRIDRLRRHRMAAQRLAKLETDLATRVAALRELSPQVSAADQVNLRDQIGNLQWMLAQIHGESQTPSNLVTSVEAAARRPNPPIPSSGPQQP